MRKNKQCHFVGDRYKTKYGVEYEIIKYNYSRDITIRFDCGYETSVQGVSIHRGSIDYPMHRTCMGIGYLGFGNHPATIGNIRTKAYSAWYNMFVRCYGSYSKSNRDAYKGVTVCDEWHNFQTFAEWFHQNYTDGFELDKDLTIRWSKSYSPETCSFVPRDINVLMTDHRADRGNWPIGVGKRKNRFVARCYNAKGTRDQLGYFLTPEDAFNAYAEKKKEAMIYMAEKYKRRITSAVYENLINWDIVPFPEDYRK